MYAVRAYYTDLFAEGFTAKRRDVKVVVVGMAGAGKTSLRQSIVKGAPHPTAGSEESTVHLDIDHVDLNGVSISLYDCAGQVAYYGLLQMFITKRALCLVVCDTTSFGARQDDLDDEEQLDEDIKTLRRIGVCDWLRCLSWRLPECDVVLVGTKCDLLQEDVAEDIASRIENACQEWIKGCKPSGMRIRVESGVSLTSCAGRDSDKNAGRRWECDWLEDKDSPDSTSLLKRLTHKGGSDKDTFRGATMALPRGWLAALTVLEALGTGRDPVQLVRRRLELDEAVLEGPRKLKKKGQKENRVLTMEKLKEKWLAVVDDLDRTHGIVIPSPGSALEGALLIKEYDGRILRHGAHVFLDVTWLATILKPILHQTPRELFDGSLSLGKIGDRKIVLTKEQQRSWWKPLKEDGILHPELARELWPDGLSEVVLPMLLATGLAFSHPGNGNIVVMLRLPENPPQSVTEDLKNIRHIHSAVLRVSWELPLGTPPGSIEKVLVRCCGLGEATTFWRFGVQVEGDFGEGDLRSRFMVRSVYSRIDGKLLVEVYGNLAFAGPWAALSYAVSAMLRMTQEFPGLPWEATLCCPTHGERELHVSKKALHAGDKMFEKGACGKCTSWTGGLGAFAEELLKVVDIITEPRSRDGMFSKFAARFGTLSGSYPALSTEGSAYRESRDVEASQQCLRDLTPDVIVPMETIGQRDARLTTKGEASANMGALGHPSVPSPAQYPNAQEEILQHTGVTEMRAELRDIRGMQQRLMEKSEEGHEILGVVSTMIKAQRAEGSDTPKLACLLPPWAFDKGEEGGLSEREQERQEWSKRLLDTRRNRKGWFTKEARLFFVCAHSHRLVPCGSRGQGYVIRNLRTWLSRSAVAARVALRVTLACLGVAASEQLASNLVGEMGKAVLGVGQEEFQAKIEDCLESLTLTEERQEVAQQIVVEELEGEAYEALRDFVHEVEYTARADFFEESHKIRKRGGVGKPSFVFFSDVMDKVQSEQDGAVHWVLKEEKSAWLKARQVPGRP